MASQGFSIDISKLPVAEGLPAVTNDNSLPRTTQSQNSPLTRGASTASRSNPLSTTNTHSSSGEPASPTHSQSHAMSSVFGNAQRSGSPFERGGPNSPPSRAGLRSGISTATASPRHLSPATSQIFERDVQEPISLAPELSHNIPSHILQTDDHIPAVLDQAADTITDSRVKPEDVEVIMHKDHVPAAAFAEAAVTGNSSLADSGSHSTGDSPPRAADSSPQASFPSIAALTAEDAGNQSYGNVNPNDPRRLSFISYADIAYAGQNERDPYASHHLSQLNTPSHRSPSPARGMFANPQPTNMAKQFAFSSSLGGTLSAADMNSQVRRSSASLASGAGMGRRSSVGLSSLREGAQSRDVEAGLPHGEARGELVVESLRDAIGHSRE